MYKLCSVSLVIKHIQIIANINYLFISNKTTFIQKYKQNSAINSINSHFLIPLKIVMTIGKAI